MELYVLIFLILCVVLLFIFLFLQQRPAKSADSERVLRELNAQREDMAAAIQQSADDAADADFPADENRFAVSA